MAALWLMGFAQYQDGFNRKPRNLSDCDRLKSVPLSAGHEWITRVYNREPGLNKIVLLPEVEEVVA